MIDIELNEPTYWLDSVVDFYEAIYHDLKTPMALLFGYVQELEKLALPEDALAHLNGIKTNSFRMAKLLRDANDRTNLDRGLLRPSFKNIDAVRFFEGICENARNLMYHKKISLVFTSNVAQFKMAIDENAWVRILLNLLTNAKDYSATGDTIICTLDAAPEQNKIILSVEDRGAGIPPELKEHVFAKHTGIRGKGLHSGIGLYIAKKLVELVGGEISLHDAAPGTRAVIQAPVFVAEESPPVLSVDDFFSDNAVQLELASFSG